MLPPERTRRPVLLLFVDPPICPERPAAYRVLTLSPGGQVLLSEPLAAASDTEAVSLARQRAGAAIVELWDGVRFMAQFPQRADHPT